MQVWGNSGRQWVGCVGRCIFVIVFGIFVLTFERVRARLYFYEVIALHKGRYSHALRASAHTIAKIHSQDVLSSICSCGLGLEHGWFAQRSLRLRKEMPCVLQPLSALPPALAIALQSLWHERHAPNHTNTSRTHPLHPAREPTFHSPPSLPPPRRNLYHGTSHRLKSLYQEQCVPSSRVNHLPL